MNALTTTLKQLRLSGLSQTLAVRLQEAAANRLSHAEFLELICQDELNVRQQRQLERHTKLADFRHLKTLDDFDWSFNPSVHKKEIFELATCRFIREAKDVLFLGPPGVGKTHLAQAIGYEAIRQNYLVLYRSIFDLVRDFMKDEAFNQQDKTLRRYLKPDLVIIDDMGLKQLPKHSGEYLLEVIMRRYENKATIMTSNRPLEEWGKLLCDVPTAGAIIDRFLHHAQVVAITGKSYRVKEAPVITRENKQGRKSNEPPTAGAATRAKGLTERCIKRLVTERRRGEFRSLADFYRRVAPTREELEAMLRVGAFDEFGRSRTALFWEIQQLTNAYDDSSASGQGWLLPAPTTARLPGTSLQEPTRQQRLEWEADLLGFVASDHPLALYEDIAWDTYCPVARFGEFIGQQVIACGLIIEQRTHQQVNGEAMKFLTLADRTGIVETELFAASYRSYGLATVRYPVLEVEATVEPFQSGRGFSLRVHRAGKPRLR